MIKQSANTQSGNPNDNLPTTTMESLIITMESTEVVMGQPASTVIKPNSIRATIVTPKVR